MSTLRLDTEEYNHGGPPRRCGLEVGLAEDEDWPSFVQLSIDLEDGVEGWTGTLPVHVNHDLPRVRQQDLDAFTHLGLDEWDHVKPTMARDAAALLSIEVRRLRAAIESQTAPVIARRLTPDEARALAAALTHYAGDSERRQCR